MKCRHCLIFLSLLSVCVISSPSRADETTDPCASELKQAVDSTGKPEEGQATRAWRDCRNRADEQRKKEFAETRFTWAAGLDKLPNGGWVLLDVSLDGANAVFGSRRHESRKGSVVGVWLRSEFRETQSVNGTSYKSLAERALYDCERITAKTISTAYYSGNNLTGDGRSEAYEEAQVSWTPIIPGTLGDALIKWACTGSKPPPAKAQ